MMCKCERPLKTVTIMNAVKSFATFSALLLTVNISQACTQGEQSTTTCFSNLEGVWNFTNANTGQKFGGKVSVHFGEFDEKSNTWAVQVSYDGRQTNSKCSTVSAFGKDIPVTGQWQVFEDEAQLAFRPPCPLKQDEAVKILRFKKLNQSWVNAYSLPWGKGEYRLEQASK